MSAIIKKNSQGYNYRYTDLAETHRYLEEAGQSYFQEIEVVDGIDYVVTICLDATGKELRRCRGCRIPAISGKGNPAQELGSALTYARRYSLWMAFGLATADDDGAALNPVKPNKRGAKPDGKATGKSSRTAGLDRSAEVNRISLLVNSGRLSLEEVQATVRKYGAAKMNDLSDDAFTECVAVLTKPRQSSYEAPYCHQGS